MGTVIQDMPEINPGSQPRWDRFERADLFEQYRELRTQGVSERQAAKELKVPRTTLHKPCHDFLYISGAFRRLYPVGSAVGLLW